MAWYKSSNNSIFGISSLIFLPLPVDTHKGLQPDDNAAFISLGESQIANTSAKFMFNLSPISKYIPGLGFLN